MSVEETTETSEITGKKYPIKGTIQKYFFYASSIFCKIMDNLVVACLLGILAAYMSGAGNIVLVLTGVGLVAFLIRLGITAYNYNKGRYSPIETEYRVTILENEMRGILGETVH